MSYVPPHKRHDRNLTPTPFPSSARHRLHHKLSDFYWKIVYAPHSIFRWYATSSDSEALAVVPYDSALLERKYGSKPLTLAVADQANLVEEEEEERAALKGIVKKVAKSLIETGQHAMKEREESEDVKLLVVARIGKVLVPEWNSSVFINSIKNASMNEEEGLNSGLVKKTFYTNVSEEYIGEIEKLLVEKFGFKLEVAKERYYVTIIDKCQPDSTVQCKCTASNDGGLEIYKIELHQLRYMVTDISCISKNYDLRIMLSTMKKPKNLDADITNAIDQLISAAAIVSDVKGGFRWPLGEKSVADRFFVFDAWQSTVKDFSREKIRVKMRTADRFNLSTSTGEALNEVSFRFGGLSEELTDEGSIVDVIQETVDFIWDNLLSHGSGL
ncbi:hypothetical protein LUZ63_005440 [Rhynchospora breviuscula]|uniref:DUF7903 domain-containing protein n=1 Tax=Rhynchospora breviuscula TaxID=2022672 RepID=A0A9Q0HT55_9POAL|nr:hypothetical protein LUZ63_005440 [Rhynchospora breviuscula]